MTLTSAQNERTFVPIRFISEGLGLDVDWDPKLYTVLLNTKIENPNKES